MRHMSMNHMKFHQVDDWGERTTRNWPWRRTPGPRWTLPERSWACQPWNVSSHTWRHRMWRNAGASRIPTIYNYMHNNDLSFFWGSAIFSYRRNILEGGGTRDEIGDVSTGKIGIPNLAERWLLATSCQHTSTSSKVLGKVDISRSLFLK